MTDATEFLCECVANSVSGRNSLKRSCFERVRSSFIGAGYRALVKPWVCMSHPTGRESKRASASLSFSFDVADSARRLSVDYGPVYEWIPIHSCDCRRLCSPSIISVTRRSQHSQECKDPRRQCFCYSWPWALSLTLTPKINGFPW